MGLQQTLQALPSQDWAVRMGCPPAAPALSQQPGPNPCSGMGWAPGTAWPPHPPWCLCPCWGPGKGQGEHTGCPTHPNLSVCKITIKGYFIDLRVYKINFPRKLLPPSTQTKLGKKQLQHETPSPQGITATPGQERQRSLHLLFAVYFSREKKNVDKRHFA